MLDPTAIPRAGAGRSEVLVVDRHGTRLPYSRGLMAASIMATGLAPEDAYRLARVIAGVVVSSNRRQLTSDGLIEVAAEVLAREEGPVVADRYIAWRRAKRLPRPIIVLIGGVTGVGKSVVATKLGARLDIPQIVPTDAIREMMRSFLPPSEHPEIHRSSFQGGPPGDTRAVIEGFEAQARAVGRGVQAIVERLVQEQRDSIVEGVHLLPGLMSGERMKHVRRDALLVEVMLVLRDPEAHRAHFHHRSDENAHGRDQDSYLQRLWDIRAIQDHLERIAILNSVPIVPAGNLDDSIQAVLERVVDTAVSDPVVAAAR